MSTPIKTQEHDADCPTRNSSQLASSVRFETITMDSGCPYCTMSGVGETTIEEIEKLLGIKHAAETLAQMTQDARDALTWNDVIEYAIVRDLKVAFRPLPRIDQMVVSVYRPVNVWTEPDGDDKLLLEFHVALNEPATAIDWFVAQIADVPIRDLDTGGVYVSRV